MELHFHLPLISEQRFDAFLAATSDRSIALSEAGLAWRQLAANLRVAQMRQPTLYQSLMPRLEEYVSNAPDVPPPAPPPPKLDINEVAKAMANDQAILFCGSPALPLLAKLCEHLPQFDDGRLLNLQVAAPSITEFLDTLRRENWTKSPSPLLYRGATFWVGRSWPSLVSDTFNSAPFLALPHIFIGSSQLVTQARELLNTLKTKRAQTTLNHLELRKAELDLLSLATLAQWITDGADSDRDRRVLVVGNRFSGIGLAHYHAILSAFAARGWKTQGLVENSAIARMNRHAIAAATAAFRPQLLIAVHQPACDAEGAFPPNLPAISMRATQSEPIAADRRYALSIHLADPFDPEHLETRIQAGVYVAPALYQPAAPLAAAGACDGDDAKQQDYTGFKTKAIVAYVGHAPQRPERILEGLDKQLQGHSRQIREAARSLAARMLGGHDTTEPTQRALQNRLKQIAPGLDGEALRQTVAALTPAVRAAHVLSTLRMARTACTRLDMTLVLHGQHWSRHADLRDLALPPLRRPEDFTHMVQHTLCCIDTHIGCPLRQSMVDLLGAGALVLHQRHPFHEALHRFAGLYVQHAPHAKSLHVAMSDNPDSAPTLKRTATELTQTLPHAASWEDPVPALRQFMRGGLLDAQTQLIQHLEALSFGNEDELERLLARFAENRSEAARYVQIQQRSLAARLSLDAHLRRALADVAGKLQARSDEDNLRMAQDA